jgi:hypothetical protein
MDALDVIADESLNGMCQNQLTFGTPSINIRTGPAHCHHNLFHRADQLSTFAWVGNAPSRHFKI